MEAGQIKQALLKIVPRLKVFNSHTRDGSEVRRFMELFLEQVLGYDPEEEIVLKEVNADKVSLPIQFDDQIKFLLQAAPHQVKLTQAQIDHAVSCALAVRAQLLVLTDGIQFTLYDIDTSDDELEVEAVFESDLLKDDVQLTAVNLWPICKMDCGKKVIVNTSEQGVLHGTG